MTGTHEFKVTIQVDPGDPNVCVVDLKYVIMNSGRSGRVSNSSWMCPVKDGLLPVEAIRDILMVSCDWLNNYVAAIGIQKNDVKSASQNTVVE